MCIRDSLTGAPRPGVGPHDVALAIIRAVFAKGYVKNKVMEFVGPGIASMTTDYRNGVDVMTTETTCLSSIWATDEDTHAFLTMHGRGDDYRELKPADVAYYDGCVEVDLSSIKPMIALPFHPSNGFEIDELNENLEDILHEVELEAAKIGEGKTHFSLLDKIVDGKLHVQQGVIAGCSGGNYDSVVQAARVLKGANTGCGEFSLSIYPTSQPVALELTRRGYIYDLMEAGAIVRTAFCGPCFGAGDTPANNGLSIRHTTRNFPNREGSKPGNGQLSAVALMDARSIAATAANGGVLTPATDLPEETWDEACEYTFDDAPYKKRVYWGFGKAEPADELVEGPNIKPWPAMEPLGDDILLKVCSKIMDPVTTTDELIPSGETSSFRSNPLGLAEFTPVSYTHLADVRNELDAAAEAQKAAEDKAKDATERTARLQADWENFRRRTANERIAERERATEKLVTALLPVVDDIERAIDHARSQELADDFKQFVDGVDAVHAKLLDVFAHEGVEPIDPKGEAFDPLEHQAVGRVEDASQYDETVNDVYQKGYRMADRILRSAMVTVTYGGEKRPAPESDAAPEGQTMFLVCINFKMFAFTCSLIGYSLFGQIYFHFHFRICMN